jgi:hypothetical protein
MDVAPMYGMAWGTVIIRVMEFKSEYALMVSASLAQRQGHKSSYYESPSKIGA